MSRTQSANLNEAAENGQRAKTDGADDGALVRRAQSGDREAFGELVRRYRARVYGYARPITQEPFLAEDIVQDALVRAFLHLGSLADAERFLPWLHRIVRNQAYTKLKSNPIAKEEVFSALRRSDRSGPAAETGWRDLDAILDRLGQTQPECPKWCADPAEQLMRKELLATIRGMLRCLNRRERLIFESHFFDHLPPQEIAQLFQLSSANVYQIISRSRKKVAQAKVRAAVDHYVDNRKDLIGLKKSVLPKNEQISVGCTWTSAASTLYRLLSMTDKKRSLPMVMGLSGLAFRINICRDDVHIAGPTLFDFERVLSQGLRNLGFSVRCVNGMKPADNPHGPNANLVDPALLTAEAKAKRQLNESLPEALELIHRSIDRGYPVVSWDLFVPEFGVIYGYDDEQRQLMAVENGKADVISYDHLGRGILEELFVLAIDEPVDIDDRTALRGALRMILDHYHGWEGEPSTRSVHGLGAYDVWIEAFRGGKVEPNGNAYNTAVVHDARRWAAEFLDELAASWRGESPSDDRIRAIGREAAELYRDMAGRLHELHRMFPFPAGGEPNDPSQAERAIRILQEVQSLERRAFALLESMYAEVDPLTE